MYAIPDVVRHFGFPRPATQNPKSIRYISSQLLRPKPQKLEWISTDVYGCVGEKGLEYILLQVGKAP